MTHDPRTVLESFAASLDAAEVLGRFPGLSREDLRRMVGDAAALLPRTARPARPAHPAAPPVAADAWPGEVTAFIDGGSRGNPGEAGAGVVFQDRSGAALERIARYLGRATNNTAEYQALLIALARAREAGVRHLRIFSDSELLVNQVNGRYRTKVPHLQQFLQEAIRLMREIGRVDVVHVRREMNTEADALANEAMDTRDGRP